MPACYTPATKAEMDVLLRPWGFVLLKVPGTVELVWAKYRQDLKIQIRILSGINPSGESRPVGEDAIRVQLWLPTDDGETFYRVGCSKRVNRTQNWRVNLKERIADWKALLGPNGEVLCCPKCGKPMILREVGHGPNKGKKFYGCSTWAATKCDSFIWDWAAEKKSAA
jgi:hypothetical protein